MKQNEEVRRWVLEQTRRSVAHLKYVKSHGYTVDDKQIVALVGMLGEFGI